MGRSRSTGRFSKRRGPRKTDTALENGDFAPAANGRPYRVGGTEELFQRAAIRLSVPAGSFCYDAALGSRLGTLTGNEPDPDAAALSLAREALRELPGTEALGAKYDGAARTVTVMVGCGGAQKKIGVKL